MSDNPESVEDSKKTLTADVTDDSCITEYIEIVPQSSDRYDFEKIVDICSVDSKLHRFLRLQKLLFNFADPCSRCGKGQITLRQARGSCDGQVWQCSNRNCYVKITVRRDSFFEKSKLSLQQITKLVYFWTLKYTQDIVHYKTGISAPTIVDYYKLCREVCTVLIEEESMQIGGVGKVVEVDECKFGRRRYHKGRRVDGVWIFGGIEHDTNPPKCFFVTVPDCSAETLIPLIKRWIRPGTKILSDCRKSCASLQADGYIHETVSDSVTFSPETGVHTNTMESSWLSLKKSLPKYGTKKALYESYFAEYCIRQKYLERAEDPFLKFLELIGRVYKKKELHSEAEEEVAGETSDQAAAAVPVAPVHAMFQRKFSSRLEIDNENPDYHRPEFIYPVIEVKPEDLQDVKEETADESDTEVARYSVKQEPADYDNTDVLQCLMKVRFLDLSLNTFILKQQGAYGTDPGKYWNLKFKFKFFRPGKSWNQT